MAETASLEGGLGTSLVTIHFEVLNIESHDGVDVEIRNWYHLPRVGDMVSINEPFRGRVWYVVWHDDYVSVGLG